MAEAEPAEKKRNISVQSSTGSKFPMEVTGEMTVGDLKAALAIKAEVVSRCILSVVAF